MWTLLVVGSGLIVFFVVSELSKFARSRRDGEKKAQDAARDRMESRDDKPAAGTLADAEALAGAGQYGEAIHTLLLACLEELRRRRDPEQPFSLTSREIARRLALDEGAKSAFVAIVAAAELSHFGGWRPDASDYRACLESYRGMTTDLGTEARA